MPLEPETILSSIRIGAAMSSSVLPEEIAARALALGIMLAKRDPALTDRLLALVPASVTAELFGLIDAIVEADHAV